MKVFDSNLICSLLKIHSIHWQYTQHSFIFKKIQNDVERKNFCLITAIWCYILNQVHPSYNYFTYQWISILNLREQKNWKCWNKLKNYIFANNFSTKNRMSCLTFHNCWMSELEFWKIQNHQKIMIVQTTKSIRDSKLHFIRTFPW